MSAPLGVYDRILGWRDRLLAKPKFQSWAAGSLLTKYIARRQARALFDLCAGFVYSQILLACVRLKLFDHLRDGPKSAAQIGLATGLSESASERLLAAAVSLRLVERRGRGRYGLGMLGAALSGNPAVAAMIDHHPLLYSDLEDPVALLRGDIPETRLRKYWAYNVHDETNALSADQINAYTALMSASQTLVADDIIAAYPFKRHSAILDIGGGDGTFLQRVAIAVPHLNLTVFDLPAVAAKARDRFQTAWLDNRATAIGGNFQKDQLPAGADIVSLVRVVHDHDDPVVLALFKAIKAILPPDGVLIIAEPMSGTPGAEPIGDAYFGFYLLAMGHGRPRTADQLKVLLFEAGFSRVASRRTRSPMQTSLLVAQP